MISARATFTRTGFRFIMDSSVPPIIFLVDPVSGKSQDQDVAITQHGLEARSSLQGDDAALSYGTSGENDDVHPERLPSFATVLPMPP